MSNLKEFKIMQPFSSDIPPEEIEHQKQIAKDTLERYSGSPASEYQQYIILTNFPRYVDYFAETFHATSYEGAMFKVAHAPDLNISMLDFKIGSPAAALIIDLCSFLPIYAALLLGMCGGLRTDYHVGEYFVPVGSIRGDGTSDFYFPPEVPALANFTVQKAVSQILEKENRIHHIGITHTTNKRFWEFNQDFRARLQVTRPQVVEMECATLFTASYSHRLPLGALLLISDLPLMPKGAKTKESSEAIFTNFMPDQIQLGVKIVQSLQKIDRLHAYRKHVH
jgi:AMP nucleosidase